MTSKRDVAQRVIGAAQLRMDLFPNLPYHPLPALGRMTAGRASGSMERWREIERIYRVNDVTTALDLGCHTGFFSQKLAQNGVATLGVEMAGRFFRLAQASAARSRLPNLAFLNMRMSSANVGLLPQMDLVLVLSVWHHWVRYTGLEASTRLLERCWEKANKVMLFETGETEMPESFALPDMGPDPKEWIAEYLASTCRSGVVSHIGKFKAFAPGGNEERNVAYRNLFQVSRD